MGVLASTVVQRTEAHGPSHGALCYEILVTLPRVRHGMLSVRVTVPGLRAHAGRTGHAT